MTARAAAIFEYSASGGIVEAPMMIVAAHPDDETIGMGAQICRFRNALLLQITDGAPRDGRDAAAHGFAGIPEYASARRVELYAAPSAAAGRAPPAIIEMTAYHAAGSRLEVGTFLPSDFPVTPIDLASGDRLRKRCMIDCFKTQRDLLAGFETEVERFREAPDYDFTQPAHPGGPHYERLGWSVTGEVWRGHARAALRR